MSSWFSPGVPRGGLFAGVLLARFYIFDPRLFVQSRNEYVAMEVFGVKLSSSFAHMG